ncbi:MAG: RNA polymerase sigma factor [Clostridia bacterium]|nr:RNA polymerase sigma factor [Clostridia bacterium]
MDKGNQSYQRFLAGDKQGLVEIMELYSDRLVAFINGFVHNESTAEDLMQDTYLELIIKECSFRGESQFKTWLFKIARNKAIDHIRKNRRIIPVDDTFVFNAELCESVEQSVMNAEKSKAVRSAMAQINPLYSQVLYLSFFEGMNNAEISLVIGKNKRQVEMLVYRAKESLKKTLEKEGFEYE